MGICTTDRLLAILDGELTIEDLTALPPARLRRLASLFYHWNAMAEHRLPRPQAKAGVLSSLANGERAP
jgi:hypothetical protein